MIFNNKLLYFNKITKQKKQIKYKIKLMNKNKKKQ